MKMWKTSLIVVAFVAVAIFADSAAALPSVIGGSSVNPANGHVY